MKRNAETYYAWQRRSAEKALAKRKERAAKYEWKARVAQPMKRTPIKKQAKSRRREMSEYHNSFNAWVEKEENANCAACTLLFRAGEVNRIFPTTERHHSRGRHHKLLNWEPGWVPSCRMHREWLHAPENRARCEAWGLISSRTEWNTYPSELRNAV